jgi:hypothetical protein
VLGDEILPIMDKPSKTAAPTPTAHPGHPAGAG